MFRRRLMLMMIAGVCSLALADIRETQAALLEYTAGHLDIGVAYENGDYDLHYHFGGDALESGLANGEFQLDEVYTRVADSLMLTGIPLGFANWGTGTGDVWILPQSNMPGVPFMGFATEEVPLNFGTTRFQMTGFSGPGEFSLYSVGAFGGATVYWDTFDGISPDDYLDLNAGQHAHYNWGFTAPGVYYVDVLTQQTGNPSLFDTGTLIFAVGNSTTIADVPETSSLAVCFCGLLSLGGINVLRSRNRKAN